LTPGSNQNTTSTASPFPPAIKAGATPSTLAEATPQATASLGGSGDSTASKAKLNYRLLQTISDNNAFLSVAWSPNGKQLAVGSTDTIGKIWDIDSGNVVRNLEGHSQPIASVAWNPNGQQIATASWDKTVKIWDAESGQVLQTLAIASFKSADFVAWSPDGKYLATVGRLSVNEDKPLLIWDTRSYRVIASLGNRFLPFSVAWSPDGQQLAYPVASDEVMIWSVSFKDVVSWLLQQFSPSLRGKGPTERPAWSPDGRKLACTGLDNTVEAGCVVYVWDVSSINLLFSLGNSGWQYLSIAWSHDGKFNAACNLAGSIAIWDSGTGAQLATLTGGRMLTGALAWSSDWRLASASYDKTVKIWSISP
jgi:WD40 repeat protein